MGLILGIDQGGTKTIAALANDYGEIVGVGCAAGACHSIEGMDMAIEYVRQATAQALAAAGCTMGEIDVVFAGMTGADWPHEYDQLQNALKRLFGSSQIYVENDCMVAMRSGSDRADAAVICAGTGLNAAVKTAQGERYIYGYYINSEDQGGEALGRSALKAVFNAECGLAPPTNLTERLLSYYQVNHTDELAQICFSQRPGIYKGLAPLVFETATEGDRAAAQLVEQFGTRIAKYVTVAAHRLGIGNREMDVVLTGSIFKTTCKLFHHAVEHAIASQLPKAELVRPKYEPVVGAVLSGLDALHERIFCSNSTLMEASAGSSGIMRYEESR